MIISLLANVSVIVIVLSFAVSSTDVTHELPELPKATTIFTHIFAVPSLSRLSIYDAHVIPEKALASLFTS